MHYKTLWVAGIAFGAMLSLTSGRTSAGEATEVRDSAKLFEPATIEQLDTIISEIKTRFGKDLTIRTFPAIPGYMQERFVAEDKQSFYENWIREEAHRAQTDGVFVLIVQKPGRLQIGVGNRTRLKAFTNKDRDEMRDIMLASFRRTEFDKGMIEGARFVLARMEHNQGGPTTVPADVLPASATQPTTQPEKPSTGPASRPATQPAGNLE